MVASAAPVTPQCRTKIAIGSKMILITHPISVLIIANCGLPSARIMEFMPFVNTKKGIPIIMILK